MMHLERNVLGEAIAWCNCRVCRKISPVYRGRSTAFLLSYSVEDFI
jgi:hypothetical protein